MTFKPERDPLRKMEAEVPTAPASNGGFLPARKVLDRYGVSQMTLWRWLRDDRMGFPPPIYLNRYRYWRIQDLERWESAVRQSTGRG